MASMNIYISDDLKAQMSRLEANWSEICRRAIETELPRLEAAQGLAPVTPPSHDALSIDRTFVDQGVVVKPPKAPDSVVLLSQWMADVSTAVGNASLAGRRVTDLLAGAYPVEILVPGEPWQSGMMKLNLEFQFIHPLPNGAMPIQDAQVVTP